jgi:osmoprotectant transport system substrate-binding protein
VLEQAAAEDKDAIVVTRETAEEYGLTSIADLAQQP